MTKSDDLDRTESLDCLNKPTLMPNIDNKLMVRTVTTIANQENSSRNEPNSPQSICNYKDKTAPSSFFEDVKAHLDRNKMKS